MAHLIIKKIVRENVELVPTADGNTFGAQLDAAIASAIDRHEELNEITFGFEGDQWFEFAHGPNANPYRNQAEAVPAYSDYDTVKAKPRR